MTAEEREEWHRDQEALAREPAEGQERGSGATEMGAEAETVLPDPTRVARYAEAIHSSVCCPPSPSHDCDVCITYPEAEDAAIPVVALADSEQAALVAERDELRAEVERLRAKVERVRALADAFADDGLMRHGGNVAWHIEEAIANEKGDFPDAADRRIASQRERAVAAEAKVAQVEALADEWEGGRLIGLEWNVPVAERAAKELRAALADAPAEQRAEATGPSVTFHDFAGSLGACAVYLRELADSEMPLPVNHGGRLWARWLAEQIETQTGQRAEGDGRG